MAKKRTSIIPKRRLAMLLPNGPMLPGLGCIHINAPVVRDGTFPGFIKGVTIMAQPQNDPNGAGWPRGHGGGTGPSGGGRGNNNPRK